MSSSRLVLGRFSFGSSLSLLWLLFGDGLALCLAGVLAFCGFGWPLFDEGLAHNPGLAWLWFVSWLAFVLPHVWLFGVCVAIVWLVLCFSEVCMLCGSSLALACQIYVAALVCFRLMFGLYLALLWLLLGSWLAAT